MKEKLKRRWLRVASRLPHLSRRGRLFRNLACAVLLAAVCGELLGKWSPLPERRWRKVENNYLVGPTNIIEVVYPEENIYNDPFTVVSEQEDRLFYFTSTSQYTYSLQTIDGPGQVSLDENGLVGLVMVYTTIPGAKYARVEGTVYKRDEGISGGIYYQSEVYCENYETEAETAGYGVFFLPEDWGNSLLRSDELWQNTARVILLDENEEILYDKLWIENEEGVYYES